MPKFENGARVVFFGDSITANGTWMRRVLQYYRENTDVRFEMYNAGVPGDNATAALKRLYETALVYDPTDVVIMFGMNDVGRNSYGESLTGDTVVERRAMIDRSVISIKGIVAELTSRGIRTILCSPTPYDELSSVSELNRIGVEAALYEIEERLRTFANNKGILLVDFNSTMLALSKKLSKTDETFIGTDRVHPTAQGHELMASIFLAAQGFDIKIPDTYSQMRALAERPFDEWENKRFALEKRIVDATFLDRCIFGGVKDPDNVLKLSKELYESQNTDFIKLCVDSYENYSKHANEYLNALIAHTKTVFDA